MCAHHGSPKNGRPMFTPNSRFLAYRMLTARASLRLLDQKLSINYCFYWCLTPLPDPRPTDYKSFFPEKARPSRFAIASVGLVAKPARSREPQRGSLLAALEHVAS